jgi:hypothetical protein
MFRSKGQVLLEVRNQSEGAETIGTYHLPKLVGPWELQASSLEHKRLFLKSAMLELELDVS